MISHSQGMSRRGASRLGGPMQPWLGCAGVDGLERNTFARRVREGTAGEDGSGESGTGMVGRGNAGVALSGWVRKGWVSSGKTRRCRHGGERVGAGRDGIEGQASRGMESCADDGRCRQVGERHALYGFVLEWAGMVGHGEAGLARTGVACSGWSRNSRIGWAWIAVERPVDAGTERLVQSMYGVERKCRRGVDLNEVERHVGERLRRLFSQRERQVPHHTRQSSRTQEAANAAGE